MYILDTGFFIVAREYYQDIFPSFWERLTNAVSEEQISSVSEVRQEIERYGGDQAQLMSWIGAHKEIFTRPSKEEQDIVFQIFQNPQNTKMLSKKKKLQGGPWADPFVIAKAKHLKAIIVTKEKPAHRYKSGKHEGEIMSNPRIPDICEQMNVRCISPQQFMKEQEWQF